MIIFFHTGVTIMFGKGLGILVVSLEKWLNVGLGLFL